MNEPLHARAPSRPSACPRSGPPENGFVLDKIGADLGWDNFWPGTPRPSPNGGTLTLAAPPSLDPGTSACTSNPRCSCASPPTTSSPGIGQADRFLLTDQRPSRSSARTGIPATNVGRENVEIDEVSQQVLDYEAEVGAVPDLPASARLRRRARSRSSSRRSTSRCSTANWRPPTRWTRSSPRPRPSWPPNGNHRPTTHGKSSRVSDSLHCRRPRRGHGERARAPPVRGPRGAAERRSSASRGGERLAGYTFMIPWIIGTAVLTVGPMAWSLYLSFTDYHLIRGGEWIGLQNYTAIFDDPMFYRTVRVTLLYVLIAVPVKLVASLLVAILLSQHRAAWGSTVRVLHALADRHERRRALIWKALFSNGGVQDGIMSASAGRAAVSSATHRCRSSAGAAGGVELRRADGHLPGRPDAGAAGAL